MKNFYLPTAMIILTLLIWKQFNKIPEIPPCNEYRILQRGNNFQLNCSQGRKIEAKSRLALGLPIYLNEISKREINSLFGKRLGEKLWAHKKKTNKICIYHPLEISHLTSRAKIESFSGKLKCSRD
jgi:hypothetical protein